MWENLSKSFEDRQDEDFQLDISESFGDNTIVTDHDTGIDKER